MNYAPRHAFVWDTWFTVVNGVVHAYHLQHRRPGVAPALFDERNLGHATSTDLIHWTEQPPAFGPDPANPKDDCQPWTGSAIWHEGKGYLYYTMRGSADQCRIQQIGLATSRDGNRWERYPGNPIVVPDPRWYATAERPVPGVLDCRDLAVVRDPQRNAWYGLYATRVPGEELAETSVIGCVRSTDLIHWEHLPPAFAPGKYACVEAPDVFFLNGRWYLTALTGHYYGNRGNFSDPNLVEGTLFAVAERPEGPYRELADNALLAARTTAPLICKSVEFEGQRYLIHSDRERVDRTDGGPMAFIGSLSTPKVFKTDGERLYAAYSPRIEACVIRELVGPDAPPVQDSVPLFGQIWQMPSVRWSWGERISGESRTGWGVATLKGAAVESCILEATVTLERGVAAGLAFRMDSARTGSVVALDAAEGVVFFAEAPAFDFLERRCTPIPLGVPIRLRVVSRLEHVEIYLNDELRLAFSRYRSLSGQVGLFVDRGRASFSAVRVRELDVRRPQ
jgi:hypothetical protein